MSESVHLLLLRCPDCASHLAGEKEGVFLFCGGCAAGFRMVDAKLVKVPVYFARAAREPQTFLPFWTFDATLEVRDIDANRSFKSVFSSRGGLARLFEERGGIRMYVPASREDLAAQRPRALQLTLDQPELEYINPLQRIDGFVVSLEDAQKVADFLFMTSEIEQADMMRKLDYTLTLNNPMVVVVGF